MSRGAEPRETELADQALAWVLEFAREHALLLIALFLGLALLQTVRLMLSRTLAGRRVSRHRRLGAEGEKRARAVLKRAGYKIVKEQIQGKYSVVVDGREQTVHLRGDFLTTRKGARYIAEVKSGVESVKVTGRSTRRQLLEYHFAFEVAGVLLVDMQEEKVRVVEFPEQRTRSSSPNS